jgi:aromatic-L-amino-acid decarboxylase
MNDLEPDRAAMTDMGQQVLDRIAEFTAGVAGRPVDNVTDPARSSELVSSFLEAPPERSGDFAGLLDRLTEATDCAMETAGPGFLAGVPGGGLYVSALAEFYTRAVNRYGTMAATAPAMVAMEEGMLRWLAQHVCGLPAGSTGLLTTGGSLANFSAVVTARHTKLGEEITDGTLYVTEYTHHSVTKAARLAGIPARRVRVVPCDDDLRMDLVAAAEMIRHDRRLGLHPFLLVGSAGTTDTGTIDPLPGMADLAQRNGLWFHVDAAYGGFFRLTERGRDRLAGMELADSVTLDPHKTLFLPFGTGALVVREPACLAAAHEGAGNVQQDVSPHETLPDYSFLGPELTREVRGLRVWLPLHLYGVDAFRAALDEKLDLAELVHDKLATVSSLEMVARPELSTVAFRVRPSNGSAIAAARADQATRGLIERINARGPVLVLSTVVRHSVVIRLCVTSHRTHVDHVMAALDIIMSEADR